MKKSRRQTHSPDAVVLFFTHTPTHLHAMMLALLACRECYDGMFAFHNNYKGVCFDTAKLQFNFLFSQYLIVTFQFFSLLRFSFAIDTTVVSNTIIAWTEKRVDVLDVGDAATVGTTQLVAQSANRKFVS